MPVITHDIIYFSSHSFFSSSGSLASFFSDSSFFTVLDPGSVSEASNPLFSFPRQKSKIDVNKFGHVQKYLAQSELRPKSYLHPHQSKSHVLWKPEEVAKSVLKLASKI